MKDEHHLLAGVTSQGVANSPLKECNEVAVMCENLTDKLVEDRGLSIWPIINRHQLGY